MARRLEYPTPRVGVFIRLKPTDILTLKAEARHLRISFNRLIERAVTDWIIREAGATPHE